MLDLKNKTNLKNLIDVASGRKRADLVIKNSRIVDVYSGTILDGKDIALFGGCIAGIGSYEGNETFDANGLYASPGWIDGHLHVESSYVTPEEFGRLLVPHGTSCIIADPHEIVNVCGLSGLTYMIRAAKETALDIQYMLPSCVPSTPFEDAGATLLAKDMVAPLSAHDVLGIGEFMNAVGIVSGDDMVLDKLIKAYEYDLPIDGHCPGFTGNNLNAYLAAGVHTDHECATISEMNERISRGMYVMLRHGSACHDLEKLCHGITPSSARRCILCSDDRQVKTIQEEGHIDFLLKLCVKNNVRPIDAIRMATLNPAECYGLKFQGGIAPGKRADITLFDNLADFHVHRVYLDGVLCAKDGTYLLPVKRCDFAEVDSSVNVADFSIERLKLPLRKAKANVIDIIPGGVVTKKSIADVTLDFDGNFVYDEALDILKTAVIERHHGTGKMALGLLRGYGLKKGAIALSIAHDSHNIIVTGTNDEDMHYAVEELIRMKGGILLVKDKTILESIPLPVAGLMTDQTGEWIAKKLDAAHKCAFQVLKVNTDIDPLMTLCFMSLPVIPELKLTDRGLFDVTNFCFTSVDISE